MDYLSPSPQPETDVAALRREVAHLRAGLNMVFTLVLTVVAFFSLAAITFVAPKFEKIFDDMIPGGAAKLPYLTQAVIGASHLAPAPQAVLFAIGLGALVALWCMRSTIAACVIASSALVVLAACWLAVVAGCFMPLISLIENLQQ